MELSSPDFTDGQAIPPDHACDGRDHSPELCWERGPDGTGSYALILHDPDAPRGAFTHWIAFNIPPDRRGLPAGVPPVERLDDGTEQGKNGFGGTGYNGPCPPRGSKHRYFFTVYALDTRLQLPTGASREDVLVAMRGHILGRAELMGVYARD